MRFQKYAISLSLQAHRSIRVHTTVLMRFRMSTCVKTIELQVVTEVELYAHTTNTRPSARACHIFYAFSTVSRVLQTFLTNSIHTRVTTFASCN